MNHTTRGTDVFSGDLVFPRSHSTFSSSSSSASNDFEEVTEPPDNGSNLDAQLNSALAEKGRDISGLIVIEDQPRIDAAFIRSLGLSPNLETHAFNVALKLAGDTRPALVEVQESPEDAVPAEVAVPAGGADDDLETLSPCAIKVAKALLLPLMAGFLGLGLGLGLRANTNKNADAFVVGAASFAGSAITSALLYAAFKMCHTYCPHCL